jgi:hypothetical protein
MVEDRFKRLWNSNELQAFKSFKTSSYGIGSKMILIYSKKSLKLIQNGTFGGMVLNKPILKLSSTVRKVFK